jgi:hypothetical protein
LQLTFTSDPDVPVITSPDSATLVSGQFFSYTFAADANATFTYIGIDGVKNGALPAGLSFDGIATISGTYSSGSGGNGIIRRNAILIGSKGTVVRNTITIRPPRICTVQLVATSDNSASTAPLNFFAGPTTLTASQPPDITGVEANELGGASVTFTPPTITDGNGNPLSVTCDPPSGSTFPVGKTTVACTSAPDNSGAYAIVTFNVTVQDTTPPVITAMPTSITVAKQKTGKGQPQGAIVNFASQLAALDIVDGTFIPSTTPASGSFFALGTTTPVTVTATDHAGNTSAPRTFMVTVASKAPKKKTATALVSVNSPNINGGQNATFTISLSTAKPSQPITINYTMGGSATIGTDYTLADQWGTNLGQSGSITIPSGASSAVVTLNSIANSLSIPSVTATITIGTGSGYKLSKTAKSATVTINNVP